jgi:WD40 repeat protein
VDLHDSVRVADNVGPGTATITLSFNGWKGVAVAPTTHTVTVLPAKAGPKLEPVAANLVGSLFHPDRKAGMFWLRFSPQGDKLFTAGGNRSHVVQIWDVASRKEIRRIEAPPGHRSFALTDSLAPDWETVYVGVHKRSVEKLEIDGKKLYQINYTGRIQVWDLATGKESETLPAEPGWGPSYAMMAPDGRHLILTAAQSFRTPGSAPGMKAEVWDLASGRKWKVCDEPACPSFLPDGQTVLFAHTEGTTRTSVLRLLDLSTGKELAKMPCPDTGKSIDIVDVAPNGSVVAANVRAKNGEAREVLFLDGKTLAVLARLARPNLDPTWMGGQRFTPDSKHFIAVDKEGNGLVWDIVRQRLESTRSIGANRIRALALSPDNKTLAVAWMSYSDKDLRATNDLQDFPQPRVSLFALDGGAPSRVLIAPHGFVVSMAFSPDSRTLAVGSSGAVHLFDLTK